MPYQIIGNRRLCFEAWASQDGLNGGYISHFDVRAPGGPLLNIYYNALGKPLTEETGLPDSK